MLFFFISKIENHLTQWILISCMISFFLLISFAHPPIFVYAHIFIYFYVIQTDNECIVMSPINLMTFFFRFKLRAYISISLIGIEFYWKTILFIFLLIFAYNQWNWKIFTASHVIKRRTNFSFCWENQDICNKQIN